MKKLVAMILTLAMMLSIFPMATAAETGMTRQEAEAAVEALNEKSDFYYELVDQYDEPDIQYRSEVRWWMAEGYHTDETLEEEIQAIYDAGFRGLELCQLNEGSISASDYGYGSEQWNHDFHLVLNKALDLGMTVGITSGTNWNTTNVPGLNPDSQEAMQAAFESYETVAAGASRTGDVPITRVSGRSTYTLRDVNSFIGAYAYRVVDGTASPVQLEQSSMIDLTDKVVKAGEKQWTLDWTAPEDGNYYIFYFLSLIHI